MVLIVVYEVFKINKEIVYVDSLVKLLVINDIEEICELIVCCNILVFVDYLGNVIILCIEK